MGGDHMGQTLSAVLELCRRMGVQRIATYAKEHEEREADQRCPKAALSAGAFLTRRYSSLEPKGCPGWAPRRFYAGHATAHAVSLRGEHGYVRTDTIPTAQSVPDGGR